MKYIDEEDVMEKIREEISNMIIKLKNISEEAKENEWCLEAEIEAGIMEMEKSIAVVNYYKGKL